VRFRLFVLITLIFAALAARAADVVSTWDGSSNNWTSNHWSSAEFPNNVDGGLTYDAIISAGSVTLNQDIAIQKLALSGNSIALTGTAIRNLTVNEQFDWTGGTIDGNSASANVVTRASCCGVGESAHWHNTSSSKCVCAVAGNAASDILPRITAILDEVYEAVPWDRI